RGREHPPGAGRRRRAAVDHRQRAQGGNGLGLHDLRLVRASLSGVHRERAPAHRHAPLPGAGRGELPPGDPAGLRGDGAPGQPLGRRPGPGDEWAEDLSLPIWDGPGKYEYLFFVGCAGSYDDRQKKVSRALVRILEEARVSFATLGKQEMCNGDSARRLGNEYLYQTLAKTNVETFN